MCATQFTTLKLTWFCQIISIQSIFTSRTFNPTVKQLTLLRHCLQKTCAQTGKHTCAVLSGSNSKTVFQFCIYCFLFWGACFVVYMLKMSAIDSKNWQLGNCCWQAQYSWALWEINIWNFPYFDNNHILSFGLTCFCTEQAEGTSSSSPASWWSKDATESLKKNFVFILVCCSGGHQVVLYFHWTKQQQMVAQFISIFWCTNLYCYRKQHMYSHWTQRNYILCQY